MRVEAGESWTENNLVFSNATGGFLSYRTMYDCFKRVMAKIGSPSTRFHDLRHPNVKFKTKNLYLLSIKLEISDFAVKRREVIERESG